MENRYSIQEFVQQTGQRDLGQGEFELERDRLLEINLNGAVWTKMGSMIVMLAQSSSRAKAISSTVWAS